MDPVQLPRCNPPFHAGCTPLKSVLMGTVHYSIMCVMLLKHHLSDPHITLSEPSMAPQDPNWGEFSRNDDGEVPSPSPIPCIDVRHCRPTCPGDLDQVQGQAYIAPGDESR